MLIGIDASRAATARRTGTEAYAWHLVRALIHLTERRSHRLRLYFNQAPAAELFPDRPHVEHCIIPFPRLWTHLRLASELQRHPPDVFFTPAHVIPITYRGASVATVHDLGYRYFAQAYTWRQRAYLEISTRSNGRIGHKIIADSQATKADLVKFYNLSTQKIEVVYPGADSQLKPVSDPAALAAARIRYGIRSPYLLYIGTLQPRKNLVRLIQAYAGSQVGHQLVLAGNKGWRSQPILDEIERQEPGVRQRIRLTGFVDEIDKPALISGATVLLYPSLYEGFGFPILEGQSCGTPVITSNSSSLPEVAGEAALLIDAEDTGALAKSIRRLVDDETLRRDLRQKGFDNVRRFTWQNAAGQVLDLLERAAAT